MAYRDAVGHIEKMDPAIVATVADEYMRTTEILRGLLPAITGTPSKVQWQSQAKELYEQRLREAIELIEALYFAFDKAARAVHDYATAQWQAKALVAEGKSAEDALDALIADIVATQSLVVKLSDPLRQWNDLRSTTSATDFLMEFSQREAIDRVHDRAEALWGQAVGAYEQAIRVERQARQQTINDLVSAYLLLPDFRAESALATQIIEAMPLTQAEGDYHLGPPRVPHMAFDQGFRHSLNAVPTLEDHANWDAWGAGRNLAALAGLDDAAEAYSRYREGTGEALQIDYEEAYAEDAGVRRTVHAEIQRAQQEAERIFRQTGQTAFQMSGNPIAAHDLVNGAYPTETQNWQKTLGGYFVYGTSDVVVHDGQITMRIKVHAEDLYNFNPGSTDITSNIPDSANGRFAELGWAKEFRTSGELERTVTWTIGDIASAVEAQADRTAEPGR